MIEMNNTPAPTSDESLQNSDEITCSAEESLTRHSYCKECDNFTINSDNHTICSASGCNISMMITFRFKQCPKGYW